MSEVCRRCRGPLPEPKRLGPRRIYCSEACSNAATRTRPDRPIPMRWKDDELLAELAKMYR